MQPPPQKKHVHKKLYALVLLKMFNQIKTAVFGNVTDL